MTPLANPFMSLRPPPIPCLSMGDDRRLEADATLRQRVLNSIYGELRDEVHVINAGAIAALLRELSGEAA